MFTSRRERQSRPRSHALPYSRKRFNAPRRTGRRRSTARSRPDARAKSSRADGTAATTEARQVSLLLVLPRPGEAARLPRGGGGRQTGLRGSSASCEGAPLHGFLPRKGRPEVAPTADRCAKAATCSEQNNLSVRKGVATRGSNFTQGLRVAGAPCLQERKDPAEPHCRGRDCPL